jgi:hypothetical protein
VQPPASRPSGPRASTVRWTPDRPSRVRPWVSPALEAFLDWQQRRKGWPRAWHKHTGIGESSVYLTQAELTGIVEAMDALLVRYIDERPIDDVASRPAGSVPVTFTLFAVPGGPPPGPETATEA